MIAYPAKAEKLYPVGDKVRELVDTMKGAI